MSREARRLVGAAVSHDFFSLLGVRMTLGRDFLPDDDHPGSNHVVVLSNWSWQLFFGGGTNIVGSVIRLKDADYVCAIRLRRHLQPQTRCAQARKCYLPLVRLGPW